VIGATDEMVPAQISALPDREITNLLLFEIPKGVLFDTPVPGLGAHYSKFGRKSGYSATIAGVATPNFQKFPQVNAYGYIDLSYSRRVSDSLDIKVGVTYTYSPKSDTPPDPFALQYKHAEAMSWLPTSADNLNPDPDRSGHNFFFNISGTFEAFGGGNDH